jgi:regulator of sirC expression with transglutaminase-like and TPR domain
MEATERFVGAIGAPAVDIRLDVAAFCIAAHAHPGLDVDAWCARLDDLAAACPEPTFDGVRVHLFRHEGFTGNSRDYADPENSFLDSVLTRRTGIPITLSLVMIEVGRRLGIPIVGVGMPGHFLVKDPSRDDLWCDPFHGGALYDIAECRAVFAGIYGGEGGFHPAYLAPISPAAIVARMLTNLEQGRLAGDPRHLSWMYELHSALPQLRDEERAQLQAKLRTLRAGWN